MNNILMDENYIYQNDIKNISIKGDVKLIVNDYDKDIALDIHLLENASFTFLDFNPKGLKRKINVYQSNNTSAFYIHSFKANDDYKLEYNSVFEGDNNLSSVLVSGVNNKKTYIDIDAKVSEKKNNNELNEKVKILNLGDEVFIAPKMHISVLDVIANHSATISNINEDELFYLKSKGLDNLSATKLIENGYLYGLFNNYPDFLNLIRGGDVNE